MLVSTAAAPSSSLPVLLPPRRVLVADDDRDMGELLADALTLEGCDVTVATGGLEALAAVAHASGEAPADQAFDLVISDVRMPELTGLELVAEVHRLDRGLPVLLVSAYADDPLALDAVRCGAAGLMAKPIVLDELLAQVQQTWRGVFVPRGPAAQQSLVEPARRRFVDVGPLVARRRARRGAPESFEAALAQLLYYGT